jgi:hypothetical protein
MFLPLLFFLYKYHSACHLLYLLYLLLSSLTPLSSSLYPPWPAHPPLQFFLKAHPTTRLYPHHHVLL